MRTRRDFLRTSGLSVAATLMPTIVPSSVVGAAAPSNRINVGFIGTGRQAYQRNIPDFHALDNVQIVAVCDVDRWRLAQARQLVNRLYRDKVKSGRYDGCSASTDFRDILQRRDVDAVMISTPDHWHVPMAILAAEARKHICLEKPLTLSVGEGRLLSDTVAKHDIIHRTDSEFRSVREYSQAAERVRNGSIGTLEQIEIGLPVDPPAIAAQPNMPVPPELDYNMWLGPAPDAPYTEKRVHARHDLRSRPHWMRISTYAQGMIANWGAHLFDIAQWANDTERTGPVAVEGKGEFPTSLWDTMINFSVSYTYANGVTMSCKMMDTYVPYLKLIGSEGWIECRDYPPKLLASRPRILSEETRKGGVDFSRTLSDKGDFINGIVTGRQTLEPFEVGHRTTSIAQIGLIACQLGQRLTWDPVKEQFEGNNAANALLAVPLRRSWDE